MSKPTDIQVREASLYFLPVRARVPLKFGPETMTQVTCARVSVRVSDEQGRVAEGWGETPLSVQWVWPSNSAYEARHNSLKRFCVLLAAEWLRFKATGHCIEIGHKFLEEALPAQLANFNAGCA